MSTAATAPLPQFRQPWWRRVLSHTWRIGLCYLLGAITWLYSWETARGLPAPNITHLFMATDVALMLLVTPLIVLRHSRTRLVMGILLAAYCLSFSLGPALAVGILAIGARRRWIEVILVGAGSMVAGVVSDLVLGPHADDGTPLLLGSVSDVVLLFTFELLFVVILTAIGWNRGARAELVASWRTAAELARREQSARVAQAQTAERARIAREMHDVLAHKISLISLHAGVLEIKDDLTPQETRQTAATIREASHQALEELREVLGVLRTEQHEAISPPQPSLLDVPTLVAAEESAGASITLQVPDEFWPRAGEIGPATARHAHRIIQEALTNARKHASSLPVTVQLDGDPDRGLLISISNPLGNTPSTVPGAQMGLAGLRERAALAGGELQATRTDTDFVVRAHLPWNAKMGS
ncbi:histidine kinase [Luteococcus sediminum]